ncbi:hypothetical protein [Candidatus Oleimmundimicrobium sp.]|uniref:hypothetical protein n=1 Tax=Candidatus Oleimmundimicrobium sp. TaxID=3060597 RepID=UPI00271F4C76|nr:hypothetical protein [Candidatus Oleimmundimicrobium sp.]MDO8886840.1 hypothetical protein [Candidatus Oleimmundimicrobium sp.]
MNDLVKKIKESGLKAIAEARAVIENIERGDKEVDFAAIFLADMPRGYNGRKQLADELRKKGFEEAAKYYISAAELCKKCSLEFAGFMVEEIEAMGEEKLKKILIKTMKETADLDEKAINAILNK